MSLNIQTLTWKNRYIFFMGLDFIGLVPDRGNAWYCDNMEMLSTSLALCEGNPAVTGEFPSKGTSKVELWYFMCCKVWTNSRVISDLRWLDIICTFISVLVLCIHSALYNTLYLHEWEYFIKAWRQSRCDMAFIEPMHRNKSNITYLLEGSHSIWKDMHTGVLYFVMLCLWYNKFLWIHMMWPGWRWPARHRSMESQCSTKPGAANPIEWGMDSTLI